MADGKISTEANILSVLILVRIPTLIHSNITLNKLHLFMLMENLSSLLPPVLSQWWVHFFSLPLSFFLSIFSYPSFLFSSLSHIKKIGFKVEYVINPSYYGKYAETGPTYIYIDEVSWASMFSILFFFSIHFLLSLFSLFLSFSHKKNRL